MPATDARRATFRFAPYVAATVAMFLAAPAARADDVTIEVTKEIGAGAELTVGYKGPTDPKDFISIDKPGAAEGDYGQYAYVQSGNPVKLRAPDEPGNYEIRYHRSTPGYPVAGSAALTVNDVTATLEAPATVDAGATFEVAFSGPNTANDFVSVDRAGAPDRDYGQYVYTKQGSPAKLRAPDEGGSYEVRYHLGQTYRVVAKQALDVAKTDASLDAPATVMAGSNVTIAWTGPNHPNDFVSIDKLGAPDRDYGTYAYTKGGSPVAIRAPEDAGDYIVRYHTGQSYKVIVERPLRVDPATATLDAPAQVEARTQFDVSWTGPNNPEDYVALAKPDQPARDYVGYAYTKRGNPVRLEAPKEAGKYELRYLTGQKQNVLARRPIEVSPGKTPGTLRVTGAADSAPSFGAVELILDASGSMLQRIQGERRIDLAKKALTELTRDVLPDRTPFALRVFGHRTADACQTDLEIQLAPLDRNAALAKIKGIDAKNLAKTPIGDSLLQVKQDLAGAQGAAVVILVTDGEETCDGDPKAAIESLRAAGFDVRVNIVGFAVDELALRETFQTWAQIGGGSYFDASDGKALAAAIRASLRLPFQVLQSGKVVAAGAVNGDALELLPGTYEVEVLSTPPESLGSITIDSGKESSLEIK